MIPYTLNENGLTMFFKGRQRAIARTHPQFEGILAAVAANAADELIDLLDIKSFVARISFGDISICTDDTVRYRGTPVPDYLASRMIEHHHLGYPIDPLCKFTEKLMDNPNFDVRGDLYQWLERGNMPIFPDGDFAAYKVVRADFTPIHTGPYGKDQSPGKVVEMPRHACNENRDHTCSTGLHFCSYEYLPVFAAGSAANKVILLKINPADVVAIPTDYNLSKGRTCRFEVIEEIDYMTIKEDFGGRLVLGTNDDRVGPFDAENDSSYDLGEDEVDSCDLTDKQIALNAIAAANGNKTAAAKTLGIGRSVLYRMLKS